MRMRTTSNVERARLRLVAEHYKLEVGQAIRKRRLELGLTQKELADLTHYKEPQSVSRWERGENLPGDLTIIATALKLTLAELVANIEPPDRRTARKFGRATKPEPSQLDRIEEMVSAIDERLRVMQARAATRDAEVLARIDEALQASLQSRS